MKCFITKYPANVNARLLRLGELRIHISKVNNPTTGTQSFYLFTPNKCDIEIIGEGYFTDNTLTTNNGKVYKDHDYQVLYFSNGDYDIAIRNKYDLTRLRGTADYIDSMRGTYNANKALDLSSLAYSEGLTEIIMSNSKITGDLSALSGLSNLAAIKLTGTSVTGDLSVLSGLSNLAAIELTGTSVTGDLSVLSGLSNLKTIQLTGTSVTGDLSVLSGLSNLETIMISSPITASDTTISNFVEKGCTVIYNGKQINK